MTEVHRTPPATATPRTTPASGEPRGVRSVSFNERMSGWIAFDERSYNQAMVRGRKLGTTCTQQLTIEIDDVDHFLTDREHLARASGFVQCDELGGKLEVERGSFNLFVV